MYLAAGQFPDQPGIDGPEAKFAGQCLRLGAGHVFQNPFELGAGEIGIQNQPCAGFEQAFMSSCLQFLADVGSSATC